MNLQKNIESIKSIDSIFNTLALVGVIFAIYIILILGSTFTWEHTEIWAKSHAPLLSALGILIASALASVSVMRTIANTKYIEAKQKSDELYERRLYFASIMRGIITSSDSYAQLLQTHLEHHIEIKKEKDIDLSGSGVFFLQEIDDIFKDYIKLINNGTLPDTLKQIKEDFVLAINDLIELKNKMYSLKPRTRELSHKPKTDDVYLRSIIRQFKDISKYAENLKNGNIKT